jgi:hypothetical protein
VNHDNFGTGVQRCCIQIMTSTLTCAAKLPLTPHLPTYTLARRPGTPTPRRDKTLQCAHAGQTEGDNPTLRSKDRHCVMVHATNMMLGTNTSMQTNYSATSPTWTRAGKMATNNRSLRVHTWDRVTSANIMNHWLRIKPRGKDVPSPLETLDGNKNNEHPPHLPADTTAFSCTGTVPFGHAICFSKQHAGSWMARLSKQRAHDD